MNNIIRKYKCLELFSFYFSYLETPNTKIFNTSRGGIPHLLKFFILDVFPNRAKLHLQEMDEDLIILTLNRQEDHTSSIPWKAQ